VQVTVGGGHAYVGHMFSDGVTVLDVRDPRSPKPVSYLPTAPGAWNLDVTDYNAGLYVLRYEPSSS
jgi:hypothetical protein